MKQCIILFILTIFTLVSCSSNCNVKCQGYVTDAHGIDYPLNITYIYSNAEIPQAKQDFDNMYMGGKFQIEGTNGGLYPMTKSNCYCD